MKYILSIAAIAALVLTACSEGRKTPDGYEMDNPPPSAYAPSDYETFDPNLNEAAEPVTDNTDVIDANETEDVFEAEKAEVNDGEEDSTGKKKTNATDDE